MPSPGICVDCQHPVTSGGNRHRKYHCPPPRGIRGEHRRAKQRRKKHAKRLARFHVERGAPIAGLKKHGKKKGE